MPKTPSLRFYIALLLVSLMSLAFVLPAFADDDGITNYVFIPMASSGGEQLAHVADNLLGDDIDTEGPNAVNFGEVCAGISAERTVVLEVTRNGNAGSTNVFKDGAVVTISKLSQAGTGFSAAISGGNTITLPGNWGTLPNTTVSVQKVNATITLLATGGTSGNVVFRSSGFNSSNAPINRDTTVTVNWTVVDCTPPDTTAPTIEYKVNDVYPQSPNGSNGWYKSGNVTVDWTVSDAESGISSSSGCNQTIISSDTAGTTLTCSATNGVGLSNSASVTIKRDATAPTLAPSVSPNPVAQNATATASANALDATSDVASSGCDPVDTSSLGANSVSCNATDNAGNTNIASANYTVIDVTPPSVNCTVPNQAIWYGTNVSVPCSASDEADGSGLVGDANFNLATSVGDGIETSSASTDSRQVCDNSDNCTPAGPYTFMVDRKDPTITYDSRTPDVSWTNGNVTVYWNCSDGGSGVVASPVSQVVSIEGANKSAIGTCEDNVGNTASDTQTGINIDKTKPSVSVTGVSNGATYPLGSVPTPGCSTTDALSGVATYASLTPSGGPVGSITVTCNGAVDNAGNPGNSASATYTVNYAWSGFFQPVDNLPTVNSIKAGSAVPVKFSLGGNQGLSIMAAGYPTSKEVACGSTAPDAIEETSTAGSSSLSYDPVANQYIYVWKTDKTWAGKCRTLIVKLSDGTIHQANFSLLK
jgi:hypothetical protein